MEWPDETVYRLRALWDEGLSITQIGLQLGVSRNAVVGKARRIGLPHRPSPIIRDGQPRPPRQNRPGRPKGPTLPPLRCLDGGAQRRSPRNQEAKMERPTAATSIFIRKPTPCCWPEGDPGEPGFRFCEAPSEIGRPYCSEHCARAYIRIRDRRDEAA
jgi:GcrA cell cycle regulator